MMRKFGGMLLVMIAVLLAGACSDEPGGGPVTIAWKPPQDGVGDLQFYTDDPAEYGWVHYRWFDAEDPPVYKIRANKIKGNSDYGYGMIFCVVLDTSSERPTAYYRLLITIDQAYQVVKVTNVTQDGSNRQFMIPASEADNWPSTDKLIYGYNKQNLIEVKKTNTTTFAIYFNDQYITSFTDTDPLPGTVVGYYASVGSEEDENFPDIPVDIRFSRP